MTVDSFQACRRTSASWDIQGAAPAGRIVELSPGITVHLRATGMRVLGTRLVSP